MNSDAGSNLSDARISMVSLGVDDLPRSTAFYEALGWKKSAASQDSISFMSGSNIVIGLYGRKSLAEDAGVADTPTGFSGIALALNLASEADVDRYADKVTKAGGTIVKKPEKVFWGGYSGYFADLDQHLWEIAHNPFATFDADGNLDLDGGPST